MGIEERQWRLLHFELDDKRAIVNSLRNKNTRLIKKVETYRKAMMEIYHTSLLVKGSYSAKIGIIKEICNRYKIPKKPNSVKSIAEGQINAEEERNQ